jgi:hypothetical protein
MTARLPAAVCVTSALGLAQAVLLLLQPALSSRAAVSLANGSFETIGTTYNAALGGLNDSTGWTNLTGLNIQASSAVASSPPNGEFTSAAGSATGARYLRLVADESNPANRGAIAKMWAP